MSSLSLAAISLAICTAMPGMKKSSCDNYATMVQAATEGTRIDPLLVVSIVTHESHWRPSLISVDGEDYGLGQIRARFYSGDKTNLLDPYHNLKLVVKHLETWRRLCKTKTGKDTAREQIWGYGGYSNPPTQYCGVRHRKLLKNPKGVQEVLAMRQRIEKRIVTRRSSDVASNSQKRKSNKR